MTTLLYFFSILMVVATALPTLNKKSWWVTNCDFLRLQILIITIVLLCIFLISYPLNDIWSQLIFSLLVAVMIIQAIKIFPYTRFAKREVPRSNSDESAISLITCNVLMENRNIDKCIDLIKENNADLVLLVEVDDWWVSKLKTLYPQYAYQVEYPLNNTYGMLLLSKLELIKPEVKFLVKKEIPSIHTEVKLSQEQSFRLICLHPSPPTPPVIDNTSNHSAQRDAELLKAGKLVKNETSPVIVLGDLNDVAWSDTTSDFQNISRLRDPRRGRGLYNSFHAKYFFLRFPLDHIFHSSEFNLIELKKLAKIGSDHFPIFIKLALENKQSRR